MTHEHSALYCEELEAISAELSSADWAYFEYAELVSDHIFEHMERHGVSKAELSRRLGRSRAFVTKVLRGDVNMTFRTFTTILHALGAKPITRIVEADASTCWDDNCWRRYQGRVCSAEKSFSRAVMEGRGVPQGSYLPLNNTADTVEASAA